MSRVWTNEQKAAISLKGTGLLVSAGAGSGKTAVLVERIASMVTKENPVDIDRILIVTFTNAAASEMRERILKIIRQRQMENPNDENLKKQISLLGRASIMTIDSFCKKVVDENIHLSGINPGYSIVSGDDLTLLTTDALNEVLEDEFNKSYEDFIKIADILTEEGDTEGLGNKIKRLANFSESFVDPDGWIRNSVKNYDDIDKVFDEYKNIMLDVIEDGHKYLNTALENIIDEPVFKNNIVEQLTKEVNVLKAIKEKLNEDLSYEELALLLSTIEFERLNSPRLKKDDLDNLELREEVKTLRDKSKKLLSDYTSWIKVDKDIMVERLKELKNPIEYLGEVTIKYRKALREKMEDKSGVTFSDIAHGALKILIDEEGNPTETALRYRNFYEEIMIDEYQDSNDVQEYILNSISKDGSNVFMVGDVKQSIYRFRQANPSLFLSKYREFMDYNEVSDEDEEVKLKGRKIMLYQNFRSRTNVLDTVNLIFKSIMSKKAGDIDYGEKEKLIPGSIIYKEEKDPYCLEVNFIDLKNNDDDYSNTEESEGSSNFDNDSSDSRNRNDSNEDIMLEDLSGIDIEASFVAERIKELVEVERMQVTDENGRRDLTYKDIVILLRSTSTSASTFKEALSSKGIPVYSDDKTGYFNNMEIETMVSLLKVIDNPIDDIPLIALLRSPIYGFSEEDLIRIRIVEKNKYFYDSLVSLYKIKRSELEDKISKGEKLTGDLVVAQKVQKVLEDLEKWRNKSLYMPIDEFLWMLYQETNFYEYAYAMVNGRQRAANLRLLFKKAGDYENSTYKGIYNFIRYLDKLKKGKGDMADARILSEDENVVRVMSIHKSKGLEFPVVFLSNLGKKFNRMDEMGSFLIHNTKGVGIRHLDTENNVINDTLKYKIIKEAIRRDSMSEEMRILYVALTRAKERLILTGTLRGREKAIEKWKLSGAMMEDGIKSSRESLNDLTMADWIMPVLFSLDGINERKDNERDNEIYLDGVFTLKIKDKREVSLIEKKGHVNDPRDFWNNEELQDEEVINRLNWIYPYEDETKLPGKVSVSVIKKKAMEENKELIESSYSMGEENYKKDTIKTESEIKKPNFLKEVKSLSGADKGIAFHTVMMHVNPMISTTEEATLEIESLVKKEILLKQEADSVDPNKIIAFLKSDIGLRFRDAYLHGFLFREETFYDTMEANKIFTTTDSKEKITVIGIIDAFLVEDDNIVLIDYKTDYVPPNADDFLLLRYQRQIELYSAAIERITSMKVKEAYLYSVSEEKVVEVPLG